MRFFWPKERSIHLTYSSFIMRKEMVDILYITTTKQL
jgi:hypothetical protein